MTTRRKFLKTGPIAALGLAGLALGAEAAVASKAMEGMAISHPFPNAEVITHTGQKLRFFDDLIKDKVVMINFMAIGNESNYPVTARLAKVADLLGNKLGRDVFMVSVTREPAKDTQADLKNFAAKFGSRSGWTFVRTDVPILNVLEERVYHRHGADTTDSGLLLNLTNHKQLTSRSVDIVFYGNSRAGLWGTFPIDILAEDAARRISWVIPSSIQVGELHRAGPRQINTHGYSSDNRQA